MRWEERDTQRGRNSGGYFVPLLKNESNSPSSPLAPFFYFQPTCQLHCYLMALLVEAVDGRGEKNTRRTLHSRAKPLPLKKKNKKKDLVSASFQNEWKSFSLSCLKKRKEKRGLQQWKWDKNKKKGLWRLESSTLPCVSFRTLECLNQCRRQLEAVGDELQGGAASSLSPGSYMDRSAHS